MEDQHNEYDPTSPEPDQSVNAELVPTVKEIQPGDVKPGQTVEEAQAEANKEHQLKVLVPPSEK